MATSLYKLALELEEAGGGPLPGYVVGIAQIPEWLVEMMREEADETEEEEASE